MLSSEELESLKKPLGVLIRDDEISKERLNEYIDEGLIISIGDATTDRLISLDIIPSIQIVDGRERRISRKPAGKYHSTEVRCKNPAGSITYDAVNAFKIALDANKPVRILVDGEEDLFGLIALSFAPINATIFYGQPLEGIVVLKVADNIKDRFKSLIDRIVSLKGNDDVAAV